ncbi:MAG: YggS family pyridoxal phosphate-dependent enzyme [Pseudomonadota bacterium]
MIRVTENLRIIRDLLSKAAADAGREPGSVTLLAVSKKQPLEAVLEAASAGQRDFGENFAQEGIEKMTAAGRGDLVWHFIGHLQSNKTRPVAEHFDWVHTVDRLKIARRLSEQRPAELEPLKICVQVNLDNETSKSGVAAADAIDLAAAVGALPRLKLRGFMCIPAPVETPAEQRQAFSRLRAIAALAVDKGLPVDTLSMGMSDDYVAAVAEGATIVRIGTAVFGPRPGPV